jgi:hypothetical protein
LEINAKGFQETVTQELDVIQNRVRYLISDANWVEDGRYKEAILRGVLKRFLPKTVSLGTGFVIDTQAIEKKISNQIDIIIYDNSVPVLFNEGDFIVTTPDNVLGIIEVKTRIKSNDIISIMKKANENGYLLKPHTFNGIFAYNANITENFLDRIRQELPMSRGVVTHLSLGKNVFIRFWPPRFDSDEQPTKYYKMYKLESLSFSYFISNLVSRITNDADSELKNWFRYPIDKEEHLVETIFFR